MVKQVQQEPTRTSRLSILRTWTATKWKKLKDNAAKLIRSYFSTDNVEEQYLDYSQLKHYVISKIEHDNQQWTQTRVNILRKLWTGIDESGHTANNRKHRRFKKYLQSRDSGLKVDEFYCPICLEILIEPTATYCGHSFCSKCLDEVLTFGSKCPVCRADIKGAETSQCSKLNKFIAAYSFTYYSKLNELIITKYKQYQYDRRIIENTNWKHSRAVDWQNLKVGDKIDAKDTYSIWCEAVVLYLYKTGIYVNSLRIHYLQWSKIYDYIIDLPTSRFAKHSFYTSRLYIQHYSLQYYDENESGAVVIGAPYDRMYDHRIFFNILHLHNNYTGQHNHLVYRNSIFDKTYIDLIRAYSQRIRHLGILNRTLFAARREAILAYNNLPQLNQWHDNYIVNNSDGNNNNHNYPINPYSSSYEADYYDLYVESLHQQPLWIDNQGYDEEEEEEDSEDQHELLSGLNPNLSAIVYNRNTGRMENSYESVSVNEQFRFLFEYEDNPYRNFQQIEDPSGDDNSAYPYPQ